MLTAFFSAFFSAIFWNRHTSFSQADDYKAEGHQKTSEQVKQDSKLIGAVAASPAECVCF